MATEAIYRQVLQDTGQTVNSVSSDSNGLKDNYYENNDN